MKKSVIPERFSHYYNEWHFAPASKIDNFVFCSGVTGTQPGRDISSDPETQFRAAFETVSLYLEEAGLSLRDIVEMTTYHVDLRAHLDIFMRVKDEYIKEPYPAWSAIGVSELITEGAFVEIRVIAHRS